MESSHERDLKMISEMLSNIIDENLLDNHSAELENRYGKASGTLKKILFNSSFRSELEILKQLKSDSESSKKP